MTVADLQKYFRALADAVVSAKGTAAKDLADAADRLGPFAQLSVADFARFLGLAWEYKTTGKIPVLLVNKGGRAAPGRLAKPAKIVVTPADAIARVKALHERAIDPAITREHVKQEVESLAGLTKAHLDTVANGCGFTQKFKRKDDVVNALIGYVMGRKGAVERADA